MRGLTVLTGSICPIGFRSMVNEKIKFLTGLTENSIVEEINSSGQASLHK